MNRLTTKKDQRRNNTITYISHKHKFIKITKQLRTYMIDPGPADQWGADKHQTRKNTERKSHYITQTPYR